MMHGLRDTMVSLHIEAGYDHSTITLRTEHCDIQSLRNYHNLCGNVGLQQIRRMFTSESGTDSDKR